MDKTNELEQNIQNLVEAKVLNLDITLESLLRGGTLSGFDPWDVWCGNGWILRRRGPRPIQLNEIEMIREIVQQELKLERQG